MIRYLTAAGVTAMSSGAPVSVIVHTNARLPRRPRADAERSFLASGRIAR